MSALPASSLLRLIWLASPALPVGGFSYSEGLEAAVDAALVTDEAQASDWLLAQLQLSQARSDLPVLAQALQAWRERDLARVRELNDWVLQTRETSELRQQQVAGLGLVGDQSGIDRRLQTFRIGKAPDRQRRRGQPDQPEQARCRQRRHGRLTQW